MSRSLRYAQVRTIALLFCGYAACYYCRADLSVAAPLVADELGRHGISHADALVHIGSLTSLGVLAYALGKLFLTGLGDYWGGRRNFLIGLGGATVFTLLFAAGGALPVFTFAWIGNRLTQSVGWAGLIKVSSRWFDFSSYGSIVGILSVSYLVGDALARQQMGVLIEHGYGWRALFVFAALVAGAALLANLLWLRESRADEGHPEARANPLNLFSAAESRPASVAALLLPLLRSRAFLLVCLLSFGCTIIRETFNTWTPVYLHDHLGYDASRRRRPERDLSGRGRGVGAGGRLAERPARASTAARCSCSSGWPAAAASLLMLMSVRSGAGGTFVPAAHHRCRRLLPARALFLPGRRLRARLRRQAGQRGLLGHHRRHRVSGRRACRRQRGAPVQCRRLGRRVRALAAISGLAALCAGAPASPQPARGKARL